MGWRNGHTIKLRVIDFVNNNIYKVVINEETFETYFINIEVYNKYNRDKMANVNPYQFVYEYESWLDYLKWVYFIEKHNITIYDKPNGEIIFEDKDNASLRFKVVDMDGDWIKVHSPRFDGWTQWKDNEKILIFITETLYI